MTSLSRFYLEGHIRPAVNSHPERSHDLVSMVAEFAVEWVERFKDDCKKHIYSDNALRLTFLEFKKETLDRYIRFIESDSDVLSATFIKLMRINLITIFNRWCDESELPEHKRPVG